eukprot:CAMPEP_0171181248 /NCGR_PEP_ID=MMETSP0790-20130122/14164_1 /TAXON_ID=2925 /ORGANISM="Alexandrium catenella, Strain OF101" /LENGTH=274 /DNA_ID=CAMNT_0011646185 /DNA_START=43 /DNA_END=867 /DNA_ORIENTATION=-
MARVLLSLSSVLAVGALRVKDQHKLDPTCECLDYATVYETEKAYCGMGFELTRVATAPEMGFPGALKYATECLPGILNATSLSDVWWAMNRRGDCNWVSVNKMDVEDCNDFPIIQNSSFYKHQRHSYCLKASNYAEPSSFLHKANWCYVSSECQSLNGGMRVSDYVSWKECREGEDKFLSDLDVPELCALEDMLHPTGKYIGGCQMAAFKAYPLASGTWQDSVREGAGKGVPGPARYWADKKNDAAVVEQHGRRYEVYGDARDGSDFKCVSGCA